MNSKTATIALSATGNHEDPMKRPSSQSLDTASQARIQQIVAATVDWITIVHSADELEAVSRDFRAFVRANFHESFRYTILEEDEDPKVYDRDAFIEFFESTNKNVKDAQRLAGLLNFISHDVDETSGHETALVQNTVWARLKYAHRPLKTYGNMARQQWTVTRSTGDPPVAWKLLR